MAIETIPAKEAPTTAAPHRIVITFASDHELDGMKVEIHDVTPEQCAVASYHLMRSANQLSDAAMLAAARDRGEVDRIRRELTKGGRA
jgi:hypothetical protein